MGETRLRGVLSSLSTALLGLLALLAFQGASARAEDATASYHPGDQVEFHFGARPWQRGQVTRLYPAYHQIVVRDATGYEQAYDVADVRHVGAAPTPGPGGAPTGGASYLPTAPAPRATPAAPLAPAGAWKPGDRVSVVVAGGCCYAGRVLRAGTGEWAGYYMIQFDDGSHQEYAAARNVRPRSAGAPATPPRRTGCQIITIGNKPVCRPG